MIIADLCNEYDVLVAKQQAPAYGYDNLNAPYGLVVDDDGLLTAVRHLGDFTGKKPVNILSVPAHVPRSSDIAANFLCDTVAYMLGFDAKGKPGRAAQAFQACGELHRRVLDGIEAPEANAVRAFFDRAPQWENARHLLGDEEWQSAQTMNFVLQYSHDGHPKTVIDCPEVRAAWNSYYGHEDSDSESAVSHSLVSGERIVPVKIHPKIKGVKGSQSSGASLISFNAPAFCSYGLEQNENAPMSKREAYKYTTALNALLADRDQVQHIGDDTVVSWASCGETAYAETFGGMAFARWQADPSEASGGGVNETMVRSATRSLAQGRAYDFDGIRLDPDEEFHVLALSPNAARLSVRFYLTNTFGTFARNIERHYRGLEIRRPSYDATIFLSIRRLLDQTIRKKPKASSKAEVPPAAGKNDVSKKRKTSSKVSSEMAGAIMKAILNGTAYPVSLINAVEIRINAERDVSPDKAAIIKAYYLRKTTNEQFKEVLQVDINKDSDYTPYVLGRLFSVYEQIQLAAIPNINTTIKDKYFTSASTIPARIFPILGDLAAKHLRKTWQSKGYKVKLEKALGELTGKLGDRYPSRLSLEERGAFQLGYYFENQQRFNKIGNVDNDGQGADR